MKSGSPVMEEGKEIGEVVFVQKGFNVGLALIHEFEAVKGAWQIGEEMRGIPVLPFECSVCLMKEMSEFGMKRVNSE